MACTEDKDGGVHLNKTVNIASSAAEICNLTAATKVNCYAKAFNSFEGPSKEQEGVTHAFGIVIIFLFF